jgi:hypothetical protein
MAGNTEIRQARRLSVRAATEPLPSPPPPPPRVRVPAGVRAIEPQSVSVHSVPPPPHFVTRFPAFDPAELSSESAIDVASGRSSETQCSPTEQPVPRRPLASPGVIVSLAACIAVMCAIGWYEKHGADGFKWDTIKSFVQRWSIHPVDLDEDLPFITAIPLTPNPRGTESIVKETPTKKADRVLLSDLLKEEPAATSDDDRTQLR